MDPDENLKRQRVLLQRWQKEGTLNDNELDEFMELVKSLDEWLSKGGFFPFSWGKRKS